MRLPGFRRVVLVWSATLVWTLAGQVTWCTRFLGSATGGSRWVLTSWLGTAAAVKASTWPRLWAGGFRLFGCLVCKRNSQNIMRISTRSWVAGSIYCSFWTSASECCQCTWGSFRSWQFKLCWSLSYSGLLRWCKVWPVSTALGHSCQWHWVVSC